MTSRPKTELLLLDFDGPVCSVFAGSPARQIAADMRELAQSRNVSLTDSSDPISVLMDAFRFPTAFNEIEDFFIKREVDAAKSSQLTNAADKVMQGLSKSIPIAIVSNNSTPCIQHFLQRVELTDTVQGIFGRPFRRPDLMKPDPFLLHEALSQAGIKPQHSIFVGDSLSDIEAANNANVPIIAFANKSYKEPLFAGRQVPVISTMQELPANLNHEGNT